MQCVCLKYQVYYYRESPVYVILVGYVAISNTFIQKLLFHYSSVHQKNTFSHSNQLASGQIHCHLALHAKDGFVVCCLYVIRWIMLHSCVVFFWPSLWLPEISQTLLMFTRPTSSFRNGVMSTTPCIGTAALLLTVVFSWCSGADGHRCGHQTADSAGRGLPSSQRCCCCPRTFPGRNN